MKKNGTLWGWFALVWGGIILTLTSIPDPSALAPAPPGFDKVLHAGVYFPLAVGIFQYARLALPNSRLWMWIPIPIAFGLVDELHQLVIPGRFCSILDLAADLVGIGVAVAMVGWRYRKSPFVGGS